MKKQQCSIKIEFLHTLCIPNDLKEKKPSSATHIAPTKNGTIFRNMKKINMKSTKPNMKKNKAVLSTQHFCRTFTTLLAMTLTALNIRQSILV